MELQKELLKLANSKKDYNSVADEIDRLADVIQLFYQAVHVKHVPALKDSMLYLITDMDLLDGNIEEDLLYNLQGMEYDYGKKKWVDHCPDFEIPKKTCMNLKLKQILSEMKKRQGLNHHRICTILQTMTKKSWHCGSVM